MLPAEPAVSVRYQLPCGRCGATLDYAGSQGLVAGRLVWSIEVECEQCDHSWLECGRGELPDHLRVRLLAEHGPTHLALTDAAAPAARVMQVLRTEHGLSLASVRAALDQLRRGEYSGTLPEIACLAAKLTSIGVAVSTHPPRSGAVDA